MKIMLIGIPIDPKYGTDIKTDKGYTYHPGHHWVWSEMDVKKAHGTVLASICFRSYKVPVIKVPTSNKMGGGKSKKHNRTRKKRKYRRSS